MHGSQFPGEGGGGSFLRKPVTKALNIEKINPFFFKIDMFMAGLLQGTSFRVKGLE